MKKLCTLILVLLVCATPAFAGHGKDAPAKQAIVLSAFGTTYPAALESILNIQNRIQAAFPGTPVKLAFTSNIIRKIWQERSGDAAWIKANPNVHDDVLHVKTPLATIADLQNDGYKDIAVQSLHVFAGEEFHDTLTLMAGLRSISTLKAKNMPFGKLVLGRPALGMPGTQYPYLEDIAAGAKALSTDVAAAKKQGAALVYMGHGNDFFSTGIYAEFAKAMTQMYEWPVIVGCVEGFPGFDDVLAALKTSGKKKILLKPLMVVAGDHASNDMAGEEDDAWKVMFTKAGYKVTCDVTGLGMNDDWADLYVQHLRDALAQKHMLR